MGFGNFGCGCGGRGNSWIILIIIIILLFFCCQEDDITSCV